MTTAPGPSEETSPPADALNMIKGAIAEINLPKLIAGPAGEAISRLIAGGADVPAAWLEQKAKSIRNKTEAQNLVSKTLAGAAAEFVKNDPELVQRAADVFLAREIRHQYNREAVAIKTIEHLKETPNSEANTPEDDWLNVFARHAQEASSDRLQDIWARVLAGQIRKPQCFSLQTLRFISELDMHIAAMFEKWSNWVISSDYIAFPAKGGADFTELLQLEDFGLITGATGQLSKTFEAQSPTLPEEKPLWGFEFRDHICLVRFTSPTPVSLPSVLLTRVGRELYSISKTQGSIEPIKRFAEQFPKHNVVGIQYIHKPATQDAGAIDLWTLPSPTGQQ
ncbi:DUF2806 domain-containing protein [Bradyrhizobium ontarionense]|uniref:DUF2806 domain-containing protein n=1 Tax=Bradyrhizobium ontarionense TaxID=2898149 RepID=A0ABY3RIQ6_9BRAD|nr:DUF2806 domain-containing protein [Bradyrhizobium sp. A19]UFZ07375.1 DUF2806 domain-containing protein [Bradyrhizobium sp. A19]